MAMIRGKSKYTQVLRLHHDFQKLSIEEIQEQMKDVIQKHGAKAVSEGTGLSTEAIHTVDNDVHRAWTSFLRVYSQKNCVLLWKVV